MKHISISVSTVLLEKLGTDVSSVSIIQFLAHFPHMKDDTIPDKYLLKFLWSNWQHW
jgi:hypothetical protein